MGIDDTQQYAVKQQKWNRHHLDYSFQLADHVDRHALGGTDLSHPFTQGGDCNLPTNNDERDKDVGTAEVYQNQYAGTHQNLVGHRVQKRTKGRYLVELARQITIQPVRG